MNENEREQSYPIFLLVSMALHALLFLIAPQLVGGLLPALERGDQGGVTLITLVDVVPPEQVRTPVPEAARQPQFRPQPAPNPQPQAEQRQEAPAPEPRPQPVEPPQPASPPTPTAQVQPVPVDVRPTSTPVQVEEAPRAVPAPQPVQVPSPTVAEQPRPVPVPAEVAEAPTPQPVLTSDSGVREAQVAPSPAPSETSAAPASASAVNQGEPARAETDATSPSGSPEEAGTGADQDVTAAAPDAEISSEPVLPPTGESMVLTFGGASYPKDAVGLLQRPVTVKVAAIVGPDGTVLEGIVVETSGIANIDEYAYNVATRAARYRPHSDIYEVGVFVTFDPVENALSYRVADFISVPPTVGSYAP